MSRPRFRLAVSGVTSDAARTLLMVVALTVGVLSVAAVLTARQTVSTAVSSGYAGSRPASATIDVHGGLDAADVAAVTAVPGVADAARRDAVAGTVGVARPGASRQGVRLFVADRDDPLRSGALAPAAAWPPPPGTVLLERSSASFLGAHPGDRLAIAVPGRRPVTFGVAAIVYDGALAPSAQEQTAYVYLTSADARALGIDGLERLLLQVDDAAGRPSRDTEAIREVAQRAAAVLAQRGRTVERIEIPPPGRHPHEAQMRTVSFVLAVFAASALVLSSLLVAVVLGGALATQVPRIGALKAIGASDRQVLGVYLAQAAAIAVAATAVGVPVGVVAGRSLARRAAGFLNLDLASGSLPVGVWLGSAVAGLVVPLLAALVPVRRAARITARQAMDEAGGRAPSAPPGRSGARRRPLGIGGRRAAAEGRRLDGIAGRRGDGAGRTRPLGLAVAELSRRPARLVLGVGMLAVSGALVLTGVDTAQGWRALVGDGMARRHYDAQVTVTVPSRQEGRTQQLIGLVAGVPGVARVEEWGAVPLTLPGPDPVPVTHTYPDQSHSSFTLLGPPAGSTMMTLPLREGRRPDPSDPADAEAVVVNQLVPGTQVPGLRVGDGLDLLAGGQRLHVRVVGIVSDFGTQAAVYASPSQAASVTATGAGTRLLRIATTSHEPTARRAALDAVTAVLTGDGVRVEQAFTVDTLKAALDGHVLVLADSLLVIGLLMGLVGLIGLASSTGASVTERTAEFGVLHALGATRGRVAGQVVLEALVTAAAGVALAAVLTLPLTSVFGRVVGWQAFRQPLPWQFSMPGLVGWLLLTAFGAAVAASGAAARASRLTVRQAFSAV